MSNNAYLERLVTAVACIVAEAAGAKVDRDQWHLAMIFVRNHIALSIHSDDPEGDAEGDDNS